MLSLHFTLLTHQEAVRVRTDKANFGPAPISLSFSLEFYPMYKYHIYFDQCYLFHFLRDNFKGHPKTAQFVFCDPYN